MVRQIPLGLTRKLSRETSAIATRVPWAQCWSVSPRNPRDRPLRFVAQGWPDRHSGSPRITGRRPPMGHALTRGMLFVNSETEQLGNCQRRGHPGAERTQPPSPPWVNAERTQRPGLAQRRTNPTALSGSPQCRTNPTARPRQRRTNPRFRVVTIAGARGGGSDTLNLVTKRTQESLQQSLAEDSRQGSPDHPRGSPDSFRCRTNPTARP